jgi:hypothetical protein
MSDPQDQRLVDLFAHLEPDVAAHARMEARVLRDHEAAQRSLAAEWLDLIRVDRVGPAGAFAAVAGTAAAAASLALLTSLGTFVLSALLGG